MGDDGECAALGAGIDLPIKKRGKVSVKACVLFVLFFLFHDVPCNAIMSP